MNKYQEALDYMKANAVQEITNSYFRKHKALDGISFEEFDNNLTTLQELVDKATPKKPLEIIFNNFGMGERIGRCPNCKILVNQFQTHCKCDQKLDWNGL